MSKNKPVDKPTENWTKFPNCILDNLEHYTPQELKVLAFMVRKNIGYKEPNKRFSVRYIRSKVGMSKPTVINALNGLLEKGSIIVIETADKGIRLFDINWVEPEVKDFDRSKSLTGSGQKSLPEQVKKIDQVLDTKQRKHTKKIDYSSYLTQWNDLAKSISIPTIRNITGNRRRHLEARIKQEQDFAGLFHKCLIKIHHSQFLQQDSSQSWFGFDWLIKNDDNYVKVLEGKYDNRKKNECVTMQSHNEALDLIKDVQI
jgi:hypothetical protein